MTSFIKITKLQQYIVSNFGGVFFPIFFSFYTIATILIFLQISAKTSIIKMSFLEMIQFYSYSIPEIVLYILPISFFASSVITLAKMSFDLELIVVFALQANVKDILKPFLYLSIVLAVVLLLIGFVVKPQTMYKTKEFIYQKQERAQINIKPSEFGQRFGDWLLFVKDYKDKQTFQDIVLLSTKTDNITFINAGEAEFSNVVGKFKLKLQDGFAYNFLDKEIEEVKFKEMGVSQSAASRNLEFKGLVKFWKDINNDKRLRKDIAYTILTALFPLLSVYLVISLGIFNPRYEKNRAVPYSVLAVLTYFILTNIIGSKYDHYALVIMPIVWLGLSFYFYHLRIRKIY